MTVSEVTSGQDTHVNSGATAANFADARYPKVKSATHRILLSMPLAGIADKTILSATLSGRARGSLASQTWSIQALDASWKADRVTWTDQPGVTGTIATVSPGALADGQRWTADITTLAQAVADGQAHYGWRITTDYSTSEQSVYGFDSGSEAWVLEVEVSDAPDAPSQLVPTGVISLEKWVCQVDNIDDLSAVRVQVSTTQSSDPAFDSGEKATVWPALALSLTFPRTATVTTTNASPTITAAADTFAQADVGASITAAAGIPGSTTITAVAAGGASATMSANATASGARTATITRTYAGLAADATTYWRAMVKGADDAWSDWSDWAAVTRRTKPALTVTSPAGATILDPSPTITAQIASGTIQSWQVRLTADGDRTDVKYLSAVMAGNGTNTVSWTVPDGYLREDTTYELNVRVWDRVDRVASPTDVTWIETWQDVLLDTDGSETPANTLTATTTPAGQPGVVLNWLRASNPTSFNVLRDGVYVARVAGTLRTYTDLTAPPNKQVGYTVRAVTSGEQSDDSNTATVTDDVTGIWLISEDHGNVLLYGDDVGSIERRDKRVTFDLPGRRDKVDILTAFCGYEGRLSLVLDDRTTAAATQLAILDAIKYDPTNPVRLVWGTVNIPAYLRDVSHRPHESMIPGRHLRYSVSFEFWQSGEFDDDGMS